MEKGSREKAPLPKPGTLFAPHLLYLGRKQFHRVKHQRTVSASRKAKASLYKKVQDGLALLFFDTVELFHSNSRISKFFQEAVAVTAKQVQIGDRPCRIYGTNCAVNLLLQMTDEHELQNMDSEVAAIAQSAHHFLFAAIPVKSWNDELSPWKAPAVWGKESFGGNAADTLRFLTEQVIPTLKQQFALPENVRIILGGYSLAGLFALWASTQTALFSGVAAASPSVWFPGWMEFEQQHPIQAQRIYLSLGDREEHTKNTVMATVGDNIRTLHSRLAERGADCTLERNSGGHFKDADLRTARAFQWVMEESR